MAEHREKDEGAWRHVEAVAAGELEGEALERVQEAMRADPALRRAVERARSVRRALRGFEPQPMPRGLLRRLWSIPAGTSVNAAAAPGYRWPRLAAPAVAMSVAAVIGLMLLRPEPAPEPDPREVAVQEFVIAMSYLQRAAATANRETRQHVGTGLTDAFSATWDALLTEDSTLDTGG